MPFLSSATENMAALLRSARLLKFSPSGSLQITGTKRTGPALSRLFSGALSVCSRTGVCPRRIGLASQNASSRAWPHAAGCVRTYAVVMEQRDKDSSLVRLKQVEEFDWAINKLDSAVRRTGRIPYTLFCRVYEEICTTGHPSGNQALLLLRSCGSLLAELPVAERSELAQNVWGKLQELGAQYEVGHYNALLKVYLQNEFKFSPMDFLAKMEAANIEPNSITYQRLITAYCQNGDIEGASTILASMKSKDLPITEAVFNSLMTGHARAGDIEGAENILTVMRGAGIEPGTDTYLSLVNVYAVNGDMDNMKKTLQTAASEDCILLDRDLLKIIFNLAKAGHTQHIPELIKRLKQERNYIPSAMNMCLSLITRGLEDTAFLILKTIPKLQPEHLGSDYPQLGNFFLRHCVNMNTPQEKLVAYCKELQESNLHGAPFTVTLFFALQANKNDLSYALMKLLKEQDLPVRQHYFWPLLAHDVKDKNTAGVIKVLKAMQEFGLSPDNTTLSSYTYPAFSTADDAIQSIKDAGVSVETEDYMVSLIHWLANENLAKLYDRLSDPSLPAIDPSKFRGILIKIFKRSDDVESMVKITNLLVKDERFGKQDPSPAERVGFFLYALIEGMTPKEVKAQENKLQQYFTQLQTQNVTITQNTFRGINKLLDHCNTPELIECVSNLQKSKGRSSSTDNVMHQGGDASSLEEKLGLLKAQNKPIGLILRKTIKALYDEENLPRALELAQQHKEEMTVSSYAILIGLCCRQNNVDEAFNLKREMSCMDSSAALDANKYIALVRVLSLNDRLEDALDILKEMQEKNVALDDMCRNNLFHILNNLSANGASSTIQRLLDTMFTVGLTKPSNNLCSPLIISYLKREDLAGATEAVLQCHQNYKLFPRLHDVLVALVESGETEELHKVVDYVTNTVGEVTMLYNLFFAFLRTGRIDEASKIIETPGLSAKPGRLQWFAERCIAAKEMETLEHMVHITAKLFDCDRDEMFSFILRLCKETNNWEKAEATWTKMQEENIVPRPRTLRLLTEILHDNNREVPFEVLETWYEDADTKKKEEEEAKEEPKIDPTSSKRKINADLKALSKARKSTEAFEMLINLNTRGAVLDPSTYDSVICSVLAAGELENGMTVMNIAKSRYRDFQLSSTAKSLRIITQTTRGQTQDALKELKSMLSEGQQPLNICMTRVTQALGKEGDLAGIQEIASEVDKVKDKLPDELLLHTTALAHIKNGNFDEAIETLEGVLTSPEGSDTSVSYVMKNVLMDNNEEALDKLSVMAERQAKHFANYKPIAELFFKLLEADRNEEAKSLLARNSALAEQRRVLTTYLGGLRHHTQLRMIQTLVSIIPELAEDKMMYPYLIKCYSFQNDFPAAKELYEKMEKEGLDMSELMLKRLAVLYRKAGETVPFPEPTNSLKYYAAKLKKDGASDK